jgi:hypothetical protein
MAALLPRTALPATGTAAVARLEKVGRNAGLELTNGRRCTLHEGDLLAVVFGNRYATEQFEGYAAADGDSCDLLSMGGLCGLVKTKHKSIAEPTKLRLLGGIGDSRGRPLQLREFALPARTEPTRPRVVVVCGSAMDAGKTVTAGALIAGLRRQKKQVAGIKFTGTVCGRDSWSMLDAGAQPALNFVDGGYASTYLCTLPELLDLHALLLSHAAAEGAEWAVVEIADGLLQRETAALLQSPAFTATVDAWVFATGDSLAAMAGVTLLRGWHLEPTALSGLLSLSPLAIREAQAATGVQCFTAKELEQGVLNARLLGNQPTGHQAHGFPVRPRCFADREVAME